MQCEGSAKRPRKTKMMQGPRSGREGSAKRKRTRKTKFGPTVYVFYLLYTFHIPTVFILLRMVVEKNTAAVTREQSRWWFGGYRTAKPRYLTTFLVPMGRFVVFSLPPNHRGKFAISGSW